MSLQQPRDPWSRLTAAARQARDDRDVSPPYGFSTRIAALAFAQEQRVVSLFDRFALRALGVASLLAIGSVAVNYQAISVPAPAAAVASVENTTVVVPQPQDDAVAIVLGFAD